MFTGPVKLIDTTEAGPNDAEGNPTRKRKARPTYDVMIDPAVYAAQVDENGVNRLAAYLHTPEYVDECWAGFGDYDPRETTVYLRFNTKAQAEALMAKWLKVAE